MTYRTALITGASSGLGRGLAVTFAKRGVTVYAAARRTDRLEQLRLEVGPSIIPLALDVADADSAHARVTALDEQCGGLDLVIANAGVDERDRETEWRRVHQLLKVNVLGAVATLFAAIPGMVRRGGGHLVGISSLASRYPFLQRPEYCASKAFLSMWLDAARLGLAPRGVAVTCIEPGYVKTEMTADRPLESMPHLLEAEDAVKRMARAIDRKSAVFSFPWSVAAAARAGAALPRTIRDLPLRMSQKRKRPPEG